jgi:hypothetical protein
MGAENGTRTRDPDLGKVVLYQLSYFRNNSLSKNYIHFVFGTSKRVQIYSIFPIIKRSDQNFIGYPVSR